MCEDFGGEKTVTEEARMREVYIGIILFVLWLAMPFILMATNRRLDKIIEILQKQKSEKSG